MGALPIPDFDGLPVSSLQHRIRSLSADEVQRGDPVGTRPEINQAPPGGSHASPQTSGPPINPPSHGVPSNPAQPRE